MKLAGWKWNHQTSIFGSTNQESFFTWSNSYYSKTLSRLLSSSGFGWVNHAALLTFSLNVLSCDLLAVKYLDHLRIRLLYHGEYWLPHSKTCYRVIILHSRASFFLFVTTKTIARNLCILQTICTFCSFSVIIQVLCSYSTLPLYAIVSQVN